VSDETIRATLARMGVRWRRAKEWITSPDPEYARKKARRDRLIRWAQRHPEWLLGFADRRCGRRRTTRRSAAVMAVHGIDLAEW
jgi:hypothetical protein